MILINRGLYSITIKFMYKSAKFMYKSAKFMYKSAKYYLANI